MSPLLNCNFLSPCRSVYCYGPGQAAPRTPLPDVHTIKDVCKHYLDTSGDGVEKTVLVANKMAYGWLRIQNAWLEDVLPHGPNNLPNDPRYLMKGALFLGVKYEMYYTPGPDDRKDIDNGRVILFPTVTARSSFTEAVWRVHIGPAPRIFDVRVKYH